MFKENKGQGSAEFIFVTLIVIVVMGGVLSLIGGAQDKTQTGDVGGARVLGEKIAETINTVYINGNGYSIDLDLRTLNQTLTSTAIPFNFNATVSNTTTGGLVTVATGGKSVGINMIPKKFNGTLVLTNNNLYHVKNVNGTIQIS
jgi:uncharacterized protein (UPF0333 family)